MQNIYNPHTIIFAVCGSKNSGKTTLIEKLVLCMKNSTYTKIEVVRSAISEEIVSNPEGRFLIISDLEKDHFDEPVLGFDEIDEITRRVLCLGDVASRVNRRKEIMKTRVL